MKIAITYICTGKYSVFWSDFFRTSELFFYPNIEKTYFVFTDNEDLISVLSSNSNVKTYFQRKAGWPYDTLMRFNIFCTVQDVLKDYDYCYFWNANTYFLKVVDETIIPFPSKEEGLILWRHTTTFDDDSATTFSVERNPLSMAYIPEGVKCREHGGGFLGGTAEAFIKMSRQLRDNIAKDLSNGIIAIWHDQSHVQHYATQHSFCEVPRNVICSEEYMDGRNPYVIFLNKKHHGGMYGLREMSLTFRLKVFVMNVFRKITKVLGIHKVAKAIYHKIFFRKKS